MAAIINLFSFSGFIKLNLCPFVCPSSDRKNGENRWQLKKKKKKPARKILIIEKTDRNEHNERKRFI